jgi:hypothetical protein
MCATAFTTFSISLPSPSLPCPPVGSCSRRNFITISKHQQQFYARGSFEKNYFHFTFFLQMFAVAML